MQGLNDRYKSDILNSSNGAETAYLNSYFTDLAKEEMVAATMALPGVAPLTEALKISASNFENSQADLLDTRLNEKEVLAATKLKKQLVALVNTKLISGLRYRQYIADKDYTNVCAAVEKLISDENSKTRQRRKNKEE
ncbi:hypothetical protein [Saccharicrinis aurantiacus]|uniref:hypothetical protein n=1 Tax=Saccharicrinis aurantiacus TaxID=1849719 RepID=UPI00249101E4|nr:hypothetical protein [Saccharicrinis aurantiacus]